MSWSKSFINCYRTYLNNTFKVYRLSPLAVFPFARQKALAWANRPEEIQQLESKAARWVAGDALSELRSAKVRKRLSGRRCLR